MIPCANRLTHKLEGQVRPTFYRQCLSIAAGRSKVGLGSQWSLRTRCMVSLLIRQSYDLTTTALRAVADDLLKSLYSRSALSVQSQHSRAIGTSSCAKTLRSVAICVLVWPQDEDDDWTRPRSDHQRANQI